MIFHKGSSKNWFATAKLSEAEPEQTRKVANGHSQFVAVSRCSILTPAGPIKGQLCEA